MTLERAFEDSGEDHWLCTLMVHSGWCFQYCTACENEPYCSEEFEEFYKQRRHWIASTLVNIISLIKEWSLAKMRQLDDYIKHYEELRYSTQNLHNKHMRAKRSTGSKSLDLKFKAHSRVTSRFSLTTVTRTPTSWACSLRDLKRLGIKKLGHRRNLHSRIQNIPEFRIPVDVPVSLVYLLTWVQTLINHCKLE
ncbi:uncharacterized protein LOC144623222 isoform X1 [Crassostrea virginica]